MAKTRQITVKSMVGARTGEAAVMLRLGDAFVNMPVADARKVGLELIEAAVAAEGDKAIVDALRDHGVPDPQIGGLLDVIRRARDAREG